MVAWARTSRKRTGVFGRGFALLGLVALVGLMSAPANASNFGSTTAGGSPESQVSLARNATHTVDMMNVNTEQTSTTFWAMDNSYTADTQMTMISTDGDDFDVRVFDNDYGDNGVFAWVNCPDSATEGGSNPNRWCHGQFLRYNLYSGYAYGSDTVMERRSRACHELGHTIGLQHTSNDNSCLQTYGDPGAGADRPTHLSDHDINHVNSEY